MNHKPGRFDVLGPPESRSEIIRVRLTPTQLDRYRKHCNSIGTRAATLAYRLILGQMHANDRPAADRWPEPSKRPLAPRKQLSLPNSRSKRGGAPTPRLLV